MKWKNPNAKSVTPVLATVGGLVLGAMASDAIVSVIHTPKAVAGTEEAKKENNMLLLKRVAVAGAAGYAAAGIDGNDTGSVFAKSACLGAAGKQSLNIVYGVAKNNPKLADTSTKTKKAIASAFGLACPDAPSNGYMMGARRKQVGKRALRMPVVESPMFSENPLEIAYQNAVLG